MNAKVAVKSFEQKLRERLLAAGIPIQEGPSRLLTISGQTTPDVRSDLRKLALALQAKIENVTRSMTLGSPLTGVVVFPTILNPDIASMPDFITHKRDFSVLVGLNIDHQAWIASSIEDRTSLLRDNLRASIKMIRKSYLLAADRDTLLDAI